MVYVSNESDEMVYFDNLQVTNNHARIIEENHYYAYGLKIAAISSKKLPDAAEGHIKNTDLYNDKELDEEGDLNWYDYGFRNYDLQIGRFPQLDPLTWDYPELTNYQYASNDPISNIDIDGLEGGSAVSFTYDIAKTASNFTFAPRVAAATASTATKVGTSVLTRLALITARGVSDALYNANTLGFYDAFGGNHLSSYSDEYEQAAYLRGKLGGDAIATAQSITEINTGGGIALSTGIGTAGVGAAAGGALAAHGVAMGATAAADAGWALKKLYQLNISSTAAGDALSPSSVSKSNGETNSTKRGRDTHDKL
jgi:RHS repeat-associated protein